MLSSESWGMNPAAVPSVGDAGSQVFLHRIENLRELPVGDANGLEQVIVEDASASQLDPSLLIRLIIVNLRDRVLFPDVGLIVIDPGITGGQRSGEDAVTVEQYSRNVAKAL